ncbi:MAG: hypothetical protein P8N55_03590, partial [Flavobacteriaceae bacterium]|nr:hypothetical protein [Flavobacteriaceae bacterium]
LKHPDFNSDWFLSQLDKFVNIAIDYEFSTREVNMLKRLKSLLVNDLDVISNFRINQMKKFLILLVLVLFSISSCEKEFIKNTISSVNE